MPARKTSSASKAAQSAPVTPAVTAPVMPPQPTYMYRSPYSLGAMWQAISDNVGLIFIGLSILIVGFMSGSLWTENSMLKKGLVQTAQTAQTAATQQAQQQTQQAAQPTVTQDQVKSLFTADHIKFGDANRKLLVVELSDPSCPWCHVAGGKDGELNKQISAGGQYHVVLKQDGGTYVAPVPELRKLVDAGQASFVWIYTNGHGNGEMGTRALYCANEKGKFWDVHDMLMSNKGFNLLNNDVQNDKGKSQQLADFLAPVFNPTDMKNCLDSGKYDSKITDDQKTASTLSNTGTPTFILNTTVYPGAVSFSDMQTAIDQALKS